VEGPEELVNLRPPHWITPLLGLHVDLIQTEAIFADDAVDALVPALSEASSGVLAAAVVPPGLKHIEYELLEEVGIPAL
jgi:hypothetical protein